MHERYPQDLEAASFYALALLGTSHGGRDFRIYMQAAAIVEEVFAENPRHPGALRVFTTRLGTPRRRLDGPLDGTGGAGVLKAV
jgi:hypothetical protein